MIFLDTYLINLPKTISILPMAATTSASSLPSHITARSAYSPDKRSAYARGKASRCRR